MAAQKQGDEAFDRFHIALLTAKHEHGKDHGRRSTLVDVAKESGLDIAQFEEDLTDRGGLARIGDDYTEGRERFGVFGTPTFVFPDDSALYLKVLPPPPPEDAVALFEEFIRTARNRPYLSEIKRAQPSKE